MTTHEIEKLPNGWKYATLKDVCQKITDGTHHSPPNGSEGIPYITAKNIRPFHLDLTELTYVSPKDHAEIYKRCDPKLGDVLYIKDGVTMGIAAVNRLPYEFSMLSSVALIRPNQTLLDSDFLAAWLNNPDTLRSVLAVQSGSAIRRIVLNQIEEIKILIPPLASQKQIAAIAQKADRFRRTRRYALQLSDTYLQSVFLEMFGDPETNYKNWDLEPFEDVCEIDAEMVDPKLQQYCKYLHIGGANIESVTGNILDLKTAEQEGLISGKFLINPQHILFSKIRPKLRKVAFPKIHALCSADIYPITVKPSKCNTYFLLHYLRSDYFSKRVSELAESRTNIPKVNREELAEQSIPLPPLPLQEKFAQIVQKFERLRTQQREAERQAEHLFQTILHRAFRGELTSSDINEEPASDILEQTPPKQTKLETTAKAGDTFTPDAAKNPNTFAKQQYTEAIQLKLPGFE